MRSLAAVTLAGALVLARAHAQQMPDMPGMSMPHRAAPSTSLPRGDVQQSASEQHTSTRVASAVDSDAASLVRDAFRVQENEAPDLHTGSETASPMPDLLRGVGDRKALTLDAVLSLAADRNPTLAEARAAASGLRGQARQAFLPSNPEVGYSAEHIRGGEYGGGEQGGYISQTFLLGGKLGLRRDALQGEARAADAATAEQAARVRGSVSTAFYQALVAQAEIAVAQRMLRVAKDASSTAHQLANLGQADAPDVLTAELEAEQAAIDLLRAQRTFLGAFRALAAEAGAPELPISPLDGDLEGLPTIDSDSKLATMLTSSPAVEHARAQLAAAELKVKAAKREAVPDVTFKAGEWSSGERIESSGRPAGAMGFVDAGVTLPLWNRNQGGLASSMSDVTQAQAELRRVELRIRRDAAPLTEQYAAAQFESERYRDELLPRARRAYQLNVMKYQQMATAYPQVLVSQRALFALQSAYLQALGRAWEAVTALDNFTLSGGLDRP